MPFIGNQPTAVPLSSADITDGTITIADLSATGTPSASTFLRGDNTWGSAGATAGQIIQVINASDSTARSTTSTSFVTASNTLSTTITPNSASNKILLFCDLAWSFASAGDMFVTIYRDATNLGNSTSGIRLINDGVREQITFVWYDSPASTSALTYQIYFRVLGGTGTINDPVGRSYTQTASMLAMELKG